MPSIQMSVIRALRPDRIVLNYEFAPMMDSEFYNQWLDELTSDYPYIKLQIMSSVDSQVI